MTKVQRNRLAIVQLVCFACGVLIADPSSGGLRAVGRKVRRTCCINATSSVHKGVANGTARAIDPQ
jgi:hypothetical protein